MKNLVLIVIALVALSTSAFAQSSIGPIYANNTLGSTACNGSTATNVAYVIDCRKQASVDLQIEAFGSGATASAQTFAFSRSTDGVTYETSLFTIGLAGPGNALGVVTTNIPTWGCGYMKINYITNANATATWITNTVKYATKIQAP